MSDEAYTSFLDKANEDPSASVPEGARKMTADRFLGTRTIDQTQAVPAVLNNVEEYYVSDTDEAFEPVALNWDGAKTGTWPSINQFNSLIFPSSSSAGLDISILPPASFDPQNQYAAVFQAVRAAASTSSTGSTKGDVELKIYKVQLGGTRVEYWVLALDARGTRVVGLKAKAVES